MKKTFALLVQNLRNYIPVNVFRGGQETVYTKILDAIIKGVRTMYIEGPTGMGKSFIQSTLADAIINGSNIKILLLVPKITLLSQMRREFVKFAKHLHLALFGGGQKMHGNQVTIMTYQSFMRVPNQVLKQYAVIFLDEAHKSLGDQTKAKVKQQKHAIVIGFTATSSYSEKKNLKEFLKYEAYRISIPEAVRVGMLSAIQFIIGKVQIEISGKQVTESTKEYTERLGKDIIREGGNIAAAKLYKKLFEKRGTRFIMFTASVAQGNDLVRELREQGITAEIITGQMKTGDRETLFERFRKNKFKVLVGIDVIKEGFDDPGVHGVMFVYPVGSKVDLVQGAGRATRIDELAPNKVAYVVQLMFEGKNQVWYNDALEGTGPFVIPDQNYQSKMKRDYDVVTTKELLNISDDIIESVSVDHKEVLSLIQNYDKFSYHKSLSDEEQLVLYRKALVKHGIDSREKLITFYTRKFKKLNFGIFGGATAFCGIILKRVIYTIKLETLSDLAEKLYPTLDTEGQLNLYREALQKHGINSRLTLTKVGGLRSFKELDFGVYGKGTHFCSRVLGRVCKRVTKETLIELADKLSWALTEKDPLETYRQALAVHGIDSRQKLLTTRPVSLKRFDFGPYKKGTSFTSLVLERRIIKIRTQEINELADKLFSKITLEEKVGAYRQALAKHGITSRETLLNVGPIAFRKLDFEEYGKACSFFLHVTGKRHQNISLASLAKLADILSWPVKVISHEEQLELYRQALAKHGIDSRQKLVNTPVKPFLKLSFESYGKGKAFYAKVTSNVSPVSLTRDKLIELSDVLWPLKNE